MAAPSSFVGSAAAARLSATARARQQFQKFRPQKAERFQRVMLLRHPGLEKLPHLSGVACNESPEQSLLVVIPAIQGFIRRTRFARIGARRRRGTAGKHEGRAGGAVMHNPA
jgi:hypothetical protein